jgi:hypothetical protein
MRKYLYPLTWEEFDELHREAWGNGWTYGPAFHELYEDYLVNWVYFVDYVDLLVQTRIPSHVRLYERISADIARIPFSDGSVELRHVPDIYSEEFIENNHRQKSEGEVTFSNHLKIFIGEAPPTWKCKSIASERTYFYNPSHTANSDWLNIPNKLFKVSLSDKTEVLKGLAKKQFLLIDIFPFPVIQDTEIRKNVTGEFSNFMKTYFSAKYKEIIEYIFSEPFERIINKLYTNNYPVEHALAMPLYCSLQLTFGPNSRPLMDTLNIFKKPIYELERKISKNKWKIVDSGKQAFNVKIVKSGEKTKQKKDRYEFIKKLLQIGEIDEKELDKHLNEKSPAIPILTSEQGTITDDGFINSTIKNKNKK